MKQYLLFGGAVYYPSGGFEDFRGSFDTLEEAQAKVKELDLEDQYSWYHIVDVKLGIMAYRSGRSWSPIKW